MPFNQSLENDYINTLIDNIESFYLVGTELLLGKIFDEIGFNTVKDILFRQLVIARLVYPASKLKAADYLFKYKGIEVSVYSIYRYLDRLHATQIKLAQKMSQTLSDNESIVIMKEDGSSLVLSYR
ncbi:MAG: hypothetical protein ACKVOM_10255 [Ferruginibacter sp.]